MKIAKGMIRELRNEARQLLKVADVLETLRLPSVDHQRPKVKRSRATRLKMVLAQRKRWTKMRQK